MLEQLGHQADVAAHGRQALAAIERTAYAAVLLDCQIPEPDGYQVAAEVRRREARDGRPPVPLIALTASVMAGDRECCLASGMNDHLAKPVRLSELAAVLRRWVPSMPLAVSSPIEAAPPTEQASPEVLDPTRLAEVARLQRPGRPDLVAAIIERFQAEAPRRLDALRDAAGHGDALALGHCAHALKGDSRRIGGNEVGQLCAALEALGRSEVLDGAAELVATLGVALERLCRELQAVYHGAARGPRVSDAIPRLPDLAHSSAHLEAIE